MEPLALWELCAIGGGIPRVWCSAQLYSGFWMEKESVAAFHKSRSSVQVNVYLENLWHICVWVRRFVVCGCACLWQEDGRWDILTSSESHLSLLKYNKSYSSMASTVFVSHSLPYIKINHPLFSSYPQTLSSSKIFPHFHKRFYISLDFITLKKN